MTRYLLLFILAFAALLTSQPSQAQKFQPRNIEFKGDPDFSSEELMAAAGLKKGIALDYAEMKDHSQKLMDTGVFESLSFKFDGVDLTYTLVPSPALYPLRLENLPLTPGKELEAALHDRIPLYHGKVPGEGGLTDQVRGALEEMLAATGIKATVTGATFADMKLRKITAVTFSIAAPPVQVGAIHLTGVSPALLARVQHAADHESGAAFGTEDSERNLEHAIELFYTEEGYAAARAHATRSGILVATPEAIAVPFSVSIEEGKLYKLGSIQMPPDSLVTQAEIDKVSGQRNGVARGQSLRVAWFAIASRYKSKGYLDCVVTPHPQFDEASGTVNYTVTIDQGPVYHLAFVKFDNLSDELRSRIMHLWQMLPGDPFDESYVSSFIVTAQKEDPVLMRSLAGVKVSFNVLADPQTHEVNCVLHFTKAPSAP
jgi:outer membrane protein assembly factor BamA